MADPLISSDPFHLGGTTLDGRFHVARQVAEGGFGVVYYAIQVALDRPVALKVLKTPPGMDQPAKALFHDRFAAEAKTIARIHHPNIVDVYDFGVSQMPSGVLAPWMALEWLDGRTLQDYLQERRGRGGQSPAELLALLRPVLRAFAYAHKDGIAHRDIKPANIMVVPMTGGPTGEGGAFLRILDFGIAKVMGGGEHPSGGLTRTAGMPAFSPDYAAPEQVAYGRTGPWTDVHALGLLIVEMLTDQPPYRNEEDVQLFEEVMAQTRPTPAAKGRDVGPWETVLAKAVSLSPGERWKTAGDLVTALEATVDAATSMASRARLPVRGPTRILPTPTELHPPGASPNTVVKQDRPAPAPIPADSKRRRRTAIMIFVVVGLAMVASGVTWLLIRRGANEGSERSSALAAPLSGQGQAAGVSPRAAAPTLTGAPAERQRMLVVPLDGAKAEARTQPPPNGPAPPVASPVEVGSVRNVPQAVPKSSLPRPSTTKRSDSPRRPTPKIVIE